MPGEHEARLKIPHAINLGTQDIEVVVKQDGHKKGTVRISMGGIDWVSGRATKYMNWDTFESAMDRDGSDQRPHT